MHPADDPLKKVCLARQILEFLRSTGTYVDNTRAFEV